MWQWKFRFVAKQSLAITDSAGGSSSAAGECGGPDFVVPGALDATASAGGTGIDRESDNAVISAGGSGAGNAGDVSELSR